jgi:trehalose 6-phosphate phosphatase
MRYILSARSRQVLKEFASSNLLLAFDFDGTLAPIHSEPSRAAIRPSTRRILGNLTQLYPCIVVSGRNREEVRRILTGIGFREFFGNHGIEPWNSSRRVARRVQSWMPFLTLRLGQLDGIILENKLFSVSVHYRRARDKKQARKIITEAARTLPGARLMGGKQVLNILPEKAPHKGTAVERFRRKTGFDKVIYVGDDETDEDVFALTPRKRFLSIRVGAKGSSSAAFYVRNQREVDRLLKVMIELHSKETIWSRVSSKNPAKNYLRDTRKAHKKHALPGGKYRTGKQDDS